ncbi:uncharacterized protein METZ01_LOCUS343053 [marine metagenome]|uniref:Uncharacterized protein n=1 Tax=marine metagenome TaxID=408172 RepID=A0A382QXH2_9ZZZZ
MDIKKFLVLVNVIGAGIILLILFVP